MTWRAAVGCALLSTLLVVAPVGSQAAGPRLRVIVVVDQMRADYPDRYERHRSDGFRTLLAEGAVFEDAALPYANTTTCVGHATIAKGAFPHTHGIVGNTWWDRDAAVPVDCSIDGTAAGAHISYGRPARSGNSPRLLTADTIGDELRRRWPASRVVALSLKPDSAVALGGHGGDAVTWFDPDAGSFLTSRAFATARNLAVARFIVDNPLTSDFSASWTLLKDPGSYVDPEATPGQRPPAGRDGHCPHVIRGPTGPDARSSALWQRSPLSDRLALTGDRGVTPVPGPLSGGRLISEDIQERIDELLRSRWGPAGTGYYVAVEPPYVYFGPGIQGRLRGDPDLQLAVRRTVSEVPGVLRVLPAEDLSATSGDPVVRAAALSYVAGRSGDLVIVPQPGWIAVPRSATAATTHGTSHEDDRRVALVLFGGPVRAGRFAQSASPADIAPTLASLVGVSLPKAEGRVLREPLR